MRVAIVHASIFYRETGIRVMIYCLQFQVGSDNNLISQSLCMSVHFLYMQAFMYSNRGSAYYVDYQNPELCSI